MLRRNGWCRLLWGREKQRPAWSGAGCEVGFVSGAGLAELGFGCGVPNALQGAARGGRQQRVTERGFSAKIPCCQRCVRKM